MDSWGKPHAVYGVPLDTSISNLRMIDERSQKEFMFHAIRAGNVNAIKNILQANRGLLSSKIFGYEASDTKDIIPNNKTGKCYFCTGSEKDGYFYPLHVAAESGHKSLVIMLVKSGADSELQDCRNHTAEAKANGEAVHAFYELRGLVFEATERYQGPLDRNGKRSGQGVLYIKPEGYTAPERVQYRGGFKLGLYNGRGSLYFPGTDVVQYVGRFKSGLKHGRGVEFDSTGMKVYQGTFREDKREGRGDEYMEGVRVYKGEFLNNVKHGFGIAYFAEGHRFIGRFDNGTMAGVGVYSLPNGDRFEGMFYNNKQDGPGSMYKVVVSSSLQPHSDLVSTNGAPSGSVIVASHSLWSMGRSGKELPTRFVPKPMDMPDTRDLSQNLLHILDGTVTADVDIAAVEGIEGVAAEDAKVSGSIDFSSSNRRSGSFHHDQYASSISAAEDETWKLDLAKYIRIPLKDYDALGLPNPRDLKVSEGADEDDKDDADEEEEESEMDEILGYHFMHCSELYIAYVYVCSASKVFEGRLASKEIPDAAPDFEAVYHLVVDAVDTYNEAWEREARLQQVAAAELLDEEELRKAVSSSSKAPAPHSSPRTVESKRLMFMTDKERREEQEAKQRADLAAKKGTAILDVEVEKRISSHTLHMLEQDLIKLLSDDWAEGLQHEDVPAATIRRNKINVTAMARGLTNASSSTPFSTASAAAEASPQPENEFAAELLHIMRTARSFLGQ